LLLVRLNPFCPGATGADGPHIKNAFEQAKAMQAGGPFAGYEHVVAFKFFGLAAAHADQVVVVPVGVPGQLEAAATIGEFELLEELH
jgi:hypothetical protein